MTAAAAGFAVSGIAQAIKALYGVAGEISSFIDKHIDDMKKSDQQTISTTGKVLEGAKEGFGIGYITPVAIISVGQWLLGNHLSAITQVMTAATLTNPIAMTCAAIGAILYGWGALSDAEQDEILAKLSKGLEIGKELIRSMIGFVIDKTKALLDRSKNLLRDMKNYVGSAAGIFGKKLANVTGKSTDRLIKIVNVFGKPSDKPIRGKKSSSEIVPQATRPKKRHPLDLNDDGKVDIHDLIHLVKPNARKKAAQQK